MIIRKDLISLTLKLGFLGGVAGLAAELFYFRDYWRPPSLLGIATISIEDFIFGFAIAGLSVVVYPVLFKRTFGSMETPNRKRMSLLLFVMGACSLLFFNILLAINSIFVTSAIFLVWASVILYLRNDLIKPAVYSTGVISGIVILIYIVLFNFLFPEFWNKYWLLADTNFGLKVLGNIPATEILWYVAWILFGSVAYPFIYGKAFVKKV